MKTSSSCAGLWSDGLSATAEAAVGNPCTTTAKQTETMAGCRRFISTVYLPSIGEVPARNRESAPSIFRTVVPMLPCTRDRAGLDDR